MEKMVPYSKLSKKEKRRMDLAKRQTWGALKPVTRKPDSSRAYNRKKSQDWKRELPPKTCDFSFYCSFLMPSRTTSEQKEKSLRKPVLLSKAGITILK